MNDYNSKFDRRIAIINRSILDETAKRYRDALVNTMDTVESVAMWFSESSDCAGYTASDVVAVAKMVQDAAQTALENEQTEEVVREAMAQAHQEKHQDDTDWES